MWSCTTSHHHPSRTRGFSRLIITPRSNFNTTIGSIPSTINTDAWSSPLHEGNIPVEQARQRDMGGQIGVDWDAIERLGMLLVQSSDETGTRLGMRPLARWIDGSASSGPPKNCLSHSWPSEGGCRRTRSRPGSGHRLMSTNESVGVNMGGSKYKYGGLGLYGDNKHTMGFIGAHAVTVMWSECNVTWCDVIHVM